jgi:hypothetical protein
MWFPRYNMYIYTFQGPVRIREALLRQPSLIQMPCSSRDSWVDSDEIDSTRDLFVDIPFHSFELGFSSRDEISYVLQVGYVAMPLKS